MGGLALRPTIERHPPIKLPALPSGYSRGTASKLVRLRHDLDLVFIENGPGIVGRDHPNVPAVLLEDRDDVPEDGDQFLGLITRIDLLNYLRRRTH